MSLASAAGVPVTTSHWVWLSSVFGGSARSLSFRCVPISGLLQPATGTSC